MFHLAQEKHSNNSRVQHRYHLKRLWKANKLDYLYRLLLTEMMNRKRRVYLFIGITLLD